MSTASELIKDRLGIAEVIGSYIKIDKNGANYKAKCPFHHEKTPSFFISPGRNSYYCFGCGAKGDIFTFVQEFEKVDFIGALKLLAERAGVELSQFKSDNSAKDEMERLRDVLEKATVLYEAWLKKNKEAMAYLTGRGLHQKTIEEWRLGWAPNEWRLVSDALTAAHISQEDMEAVGLVKKTDKEGYDGKKGVYDRFRSRVIFPLFDSSKRVIGYSGRLFGIPDTEGPKYLNSADGVLFNKSDILYGYHKAKEGIREWGYAILVEGQMDLLMCHQNGFTNTVATSGTSLTLLHLDKIKKISDNLMIVYDADKAGLKATLRAWTAALSLGMDVKIAQLPAGEDPASTLLNNKEIFKEALKHSKHIIEYHLDVLVREGLDGQKLGRAVDVEILPYVAAIKSEIDRSRFIGIISLKTRIRETELWAQLHKTQPAAGSAPRFQEQELSNVRFSKGDKIKPVIRQLVGVAVWQKEQSPELSEDIKTRLDALLSPEEAVTASALFSDPQDDMIFEAEFMYAEGKDIGAHINELFFELEERILKDRLTFLMDELGFAEKEGNKQKSLELLTECQDVSLKLSQLHHKRNKK